MPLCAKWSNSGSGNKWYSPLPDQELVPIRTDSTDPIYHDSPLWIIWATFVIAFHMMDDPEVAPILTLIQSRVLLGAMYFATMTSFQRLWPVIKCQHILAARAFEKRWRSLIPSHPTVWECWCDPKKSRQMCYPFPCCAIRNVCICT